MLEDELKEDLPEPARSGDLFYPTSFQNSVFHGCIWLSCHRLSVLLNVLFGISRVTYDSSNYRAGGDRLWESVWGTSATQYAIMITMFGKVATLGSDALLCVARDAWEWFAAYLNKSLALTLQDATSSTSLIQVAPTSRLRPRVMERTFRHAMLSTQERYIGRNIF